MKSNDILIFVSENVDNSTIIQISNDKLFSTSASIKALRVQCPKNKQKDVNNRLIDHKIIRFPK